MALIATATALACAEEPLPLPTMAPLQLAPIPLPATGFIKPTKSIKPPAAVPQVTPAGQPIAPPVQIVSAPTPDTRLRRLVVVDASMSPEAIRDFILSSSAGRTPVSMSRGVSAPAPVLSSLAGYFGDTANAETQKKVLDTVKNGMGSATKALKRVEVVGWVPSQGVMAIAVYPES